MINAAERNRQNCLPAVFYQAQNRTFDIICNYGYDIRKKTRGDANE